LAEKAITDQLTRILVIFGACAGLCYNAIWYFPVLIAIGGVSAVLWDIWLQQKIGKLRAKWRRRRENPEGNAEASTPETSIPVDGPQRQQQSSEGIQRRSAAASSSRERIVASSSQHDSISQSGSQNDTSQREATQRTDTIAHAIPVKIGLSIIAVFFGKRLYYP
jgi:hypothetical protein